MANSEFERSEVVFCNIKKAFDTVPHRHLIVTLIAGI